MTVFLNSLHAVGLLLLVEHPLLPKEEHLLPPR